MMARLADGTDRQSSEEDEREGGRNCDATLPNSSFSSCWLAAAAASYLCLAEKEGEKELI